MADLNAGDRTVASGLKHPFWVSAACSSALTTGTNVVADIVGATVTFNTVQSAATVTVWGVFDITTATAAGATALGTCSVDGTAQTALATHQLVTNAARESVAQIWVATLSGSGSHTIKLRGSTTGGGSAVFNTVHTTITVCVNDF